MTGMNLVVSSTKMHSAARLFSNTALTGWAVQGARAGNQFIHVSEKEVLRTSPCCEANIALDQVEGAKINPLTYRSSSKMNIYLR